MDAFAEKIGMKKIEWTDDGVYLHYEITRRNDDLKLVRASRVEYVSLYPCTPGGRGLWLRHAPTEIDIPVGFKVEGKVLRPPSKARLVGIGLLYNRPAPLYKVGDKVYAIEIKLSTRKWGKHAPHSLTVKENDGEIISPSHFDVIREYVRNGGEFPDIALKAPKPPNYSE